MWRWFFFFFSPLIAFEISQNLSKASLIRLSLLSELVISVSSEKGWATIYIKRKEVLTFCKFIHLLSSNFCCRLLSVGLLFYISSWKLSGAECNLLFKLKIKWPKLQYYHRSLITSSRQSVGSNVGFKYEIGNASI